MTSGRTAYGIALLALIGVLGIFFFPAMTGPYPVVHGPVSALQSLRAAGLRMAIMRAGVNVMCGCLSHAQRMPALAFHALVSITEFRVDSVVLAGNPILRC